MFKNLSSSALGISGHESEIIELALTFGFGGMDINAEEFAARVKLKGLEYGRRLIESARQNRTLNIGTFRLPVTLDAKEEQFGAQMARLSEIAQAVAAIGATRAITTVVPATDDRPYHENFEYHKPRLTAVANVLAESGVRLGLAFEGAEYLRKNKAFQFIHDFDALTLLVKMVNQPNVGFVIDPWNIALAGGNVDTIKAVPVEQIVAVQLAELPEGVALTDVDKKSRMLPGTGDGRIDSVATLATLAEMGYQGPVTVVPSRGVIHTRRPIVIAEQAAMALARVWKAAGLTEDGKPGGPRIPLDQIPLTSPKASVPIPREDDDVELEVELDEGVPAEDAVADSIE